MNATLAEYAARGWSLKPVLAGQKRPTTKGWPDREFGPADCGDGMNIAIRLGSIREISLIAISIAKKQSSLPHSTYRKPGRSSVALQRRDHTGSISRRRLNSKRSWRRWSIRHSGSWGRC